MVQNISILRNPKILALLATFPLGVAWIWRPQYVFGSSWWFQQKWFSQRESCRKDRLQLREKATEVLTNTMVDGFLHWNYTTQK